MKTILVISDRDESAEAKQLEEQWRTYQTEHSVYFGHGYYFHGMLERHFMYDLCTIVNWHELEYDCITSHSERYAHQGLLKPGIYDVKVHGLDKPCVGYFWQPRGGDRMCGLICFKDDREAVKHAEERYAQKSVWC